MLKIVVLPAPLGPMSPVIVPAPTSNETPSTARSPPKSLTRARQLQHAEPTVLRLRGLPAAAVSPHLTRP